MQSPSPPRNRARPRQTRSSAGDQSETIAFLSEGKSYGFPDAPVRRIETHWSVIFLVADRAYKLKRQLAVSLLDYSTVEKRERACRAELDVNAGTASDLYLGLRKISRRADGALSFAGDGPAVDWVVAMRRFDQPDLLDHLADDRRLDAWMARELADEIAAFHTRAEVNARWGGASALRTAVARWHDEQGAVEGVFEEGQSEAYGDAVGRAISNVEELLERRRQEGKVRGCHGDLRLANICLLDGRVTVFDAIEFSEELSCIDVLYDLAFLLMELYHRGLSELGNIVFNRYLDVTGDVDGLPVMPLFLSFRGAIRGQMLASAAMRRSEPLRPRLAAEARSHLALAMALLRRRSPQLIAIGGLGSMAKTELATTLAGGLGPAPGARIIRGHIVRKHLMNLAPEKRLPPAAYDEATTERVYGASCREATRALGSGTTAIVDLDFLGGRERRKIADVALAAGVPFTGLWFCERDGLLAPGAEPGAEPVTKQGHAALRTPPEPSGSNPEWHWVELDDWFGGRAGDRPIVDGTDGGLLGSMIASRPREPREIGVCPRMRADRELTHTTARRDFDLLSQIPPVWTRASCISPEPFTRTFVATGDPWKGRLQ